MGTSISFHLSEADAKSLRALAPGHGRKSEMVRWAVLGTEHNPWEYWENVVPGPFTQKLNVVSGEWSAKAQALADSLGVKRASFIRHAVNIMLKELVSQEYSSGEVSNS